jgi:ADP-ribosylglycohydrolase
MYYAGSFGPKRLLNDELRQLDEEGFIISDELKNEALQFEDDSSFEKFQAFYDKLKKLPKKPDFDFYEPNSLSDILAARPAKRMAPKTFSNDFDTLYDRYLGAWLGRCAGCALGKPVEFNVNENYLWIRKYLENRNEWPLRDFFSARNVGDEMDLACPLSWRENIAFMESDDDIRYTILALLLFEKHGPDFTPYDVAHHWGEHLTHYQMFTAEKHAFLNYAMFEAYKGKDLNADFTSTFNNPYREYIGAQIRVDFYGYMAPGNPEKAAEFAYRDACWTHRKNGIYGAMFIAAATAAAFVTDDIEEIINAGLGEIPENCRLAYEIRQALQIIPKCRDMHEFADYAAKRYQTMSAVHTIGNAVLCVGALIFGEKNPDRSVCEAVMGGLDTDCNGATVGSITGIISGGRNFGGTLAPRLNNLVKSGLPAVGDIEITKLAERTTKVYLKSQQ